MTTTVQEKMHPTEPVEQSKEASVARRNSSTSTAAAMPLGADDVDTAKQPQLDQTSDDLELKRTESQFEYPPPGQTALIMCSIMLTIFLVALDRTIIATAIPQMTNEFHSLDDIGWYGSAFLLTSCCFQLLIGRIYTFYNPKYVYLTIIVIFEIGSAICGAAPNSVAFIIGRAIAGVGSAGIMSGAVILMTDTIPLAKRPMYQGLFGAVFGVSSVVGPLLGGAFTTNVTWRWCFYINLPIGAVVLVILSFIMKPGVTKNPNVSLKQQFLQLDPLGTFFFLPSIVCLLLALQWGGTTYPWSDGRIIALFVLFGVLLFAFIAVQVFMNETATIPARIIKNRSIIAGMWLTFCVASTMLVLVYFIPFWFQAIKGVSAVQSGIDTIPMILALVVGTIASGILTSKIGYYSIFAILSTIIMPIGAGMISTWSVDSGANQWIGYQVLFGVGLGMGMQQGGMAAQTVLPRKDVPTGISMVWFSQMLGGAIFVSVGQNIFNSNLARGLIPLIPGADALTIVNTGATELRSVVPAQNLDAALVAYNHALRQVFLIAVGTSAVALLGALSLEWKSVKKAKDAKQATSAKGKPDEKKIEEV